MGFSAEVLRVLIASPSDVQTERDEIEKAVYNWNRQFAEETGVILLPSRWEKDVAPAYSAEEAQKIINEQLVNKCDILIGVFWTKLGSPTTSFSSGTLEEINIFIENKKEIMLYFLDRNIPFDTNYQEVNKLKEYKKSYTGLYSTYNLSKITEDLYKKVQIYRNKNKKDEKNQNTDIASRDQGKILHGLILSDRLSENELLLLAYIIETGNRSFGSRWMADGTMKEIQRWHSGRGILSELHSYYEAVIDNFADRGLLEPKEFTSHGNVRLYMMPINIYDELRDLSNEAKHKIASVVNNCIHDLPF